MSAANLILQVLMLAAVLSLPAWPLRARVRR